MPEQKKWSYYAFVSYSRKDEKWAKWIQERLETYLLPAVLRREDPSLPKRVKPIFRDKTDLTGGYVWDSLAKELEESRFLIVICSPNSAASDWVSQEIRHFKELGRGAQIIPFIVAGEPHAKDPEKECFPAALLEDEKDILGVSVLELGRHHAFLRVLSTMLGLGYDKLVQRDKKRLMRRYMMAGLAVLLLLLAAAGTAWYLMPHEKYYNEYVYRHEIPVGLTELTREERETDTEYYRITTQRGRVVKLERVNHAGAIVQPVVYDIRQESPALKFVYDSDGRLSSVEECDQYGTPVRVKQYTQNMGAVDFTTPGYESEALTLHGDMTRALSIDAANERGEQHSEIARQLQAYDENGYLTQVLYMRDNRNTPVCDANGIYGRRYERDEMGRIIRVIYLGRDGEPMRAAKGGNPVVMTEFIYDERGNMIRDVNYDAEGEPVADSLGTISTRISFDDFGRLVRYESVDGAGNLICGAEGYACSEYVYGDDGFMSEGRFYDDRMQPVYGRDGGAHWLLLDHDALGRDTGRRYFDEHGQPTVNGDGVHRYACEYDETGHMTAYCVYDAAGNPCLDRSMGTHGMLHEFDESGRLSAQSWIGVDGSLTANINGFACIRYIYDDRGNMTRTEYLDAQGQPVNSRWGNASYEATFDHLDHMVRQAYYDADGQPCYTSDKLSVVEWEYDMLGNMTVERYLKPDGSPHQDAEGVYEYKYEYSSEGLLTREFRTAPTGAVMSSSDRATEIRYTYDESGNLTARAYYDNLGKPSERDGCAFIHYVYDGRGQKTEESWFDEQGLPVMGAVCRMTYEYDHMGRVIRVDRYDVNGLYAADYATLTYVYDGFGNVIEETYYDAQGNLYADMETGCARFVREYDMRHREIGQRRYDAQGSLIAGENGYALWRGTYDECGDLVREEYYASDEALAAGEAVYIAECERDAMGYAAVRRDIYADGSGMELRYTYNLAGDMLTAEQYALDGSPLEEGVFYYEQDVNALGLPIEQRYYDAQGNPVDLASGYVPVFRYEYNEYWEQTALSYFYADGTPLGIEGTHRHETVYDRNGYYTIGERYFDETGALIYDERVCVVILEVLEDTPAAQAGLQAWDVLLAYNDWEYRLDAQEQVYLQLTARLGEYTKAPKRIAVGRWTDDGWAIHACDLPIGAMGVRLVDLSEDVRVLDMLMDAYGAWKAEQAKTGIAP